MGAACTALDAEGKLDRSSSSEFPLNSHVPIQGRLQENVDILSLLFHLCLRIIESPLSHAH
jgi:hypothetical protein